MAYDGVLAALRGTVVPNEIIVIDNSGDGSGAHHLKPLIDKFTNVFIWPQERNLGVAGSWNKFHDTIQNDYIIIANDDVTVHPYSIEYLLQATNKHPNEVLFSGSSSSGNAFSFFLLKQEGYKKIGGFDTAFYPAYYEDNDYVIRANLLGYNLIALDYVTYDHKPSSTLARYSAAEMETHHHNFQRNTRYFVSKWGGLPNAITYKEPFGGEI